MGYEGLRTLTGMPTVYLNHGRGTNSTANTERYDLLKTLSEKNIPMTTPCCNSASGPDGLISGHAYTLLDVLQLSTGTNLLKSGIHGHKNHTMELGVTAVANGLML